MCLNKFVGVLTNGKINLNNGTCLLAPCIAPPISNHAPPAKSSVNVAIREYCFASSLTKRPNSSKPSASNFLTNLSNSTPLRFLVSAFCTANSCSLPL